MQPPSLDDVDLELLRLLQVDGRRSVAALARDLGLAESTCAGRVRSLADRGIVRGFVADIDAASVGFAVEAMVAIRFSGHVRTQVEAFRDVHVAAPGSDALRNFVLDHLANRPGVVHAETSLIFEATRGAGLLPLAPAAAATQASASARRARS